MPRDKSSKADLKKKQKAFDELRGTTDNPCKIKLFPKRPRTYGTRNNVRYIGFKSCWILNICLY